MKREMMVRFLTILSIGLVVAVLWANLPAGAGAQGPALNTQAAVGSAFTYQGRLSDDGSPAEGDFDFRFTLHDAQSGGNQAGSPVTVDEVTVTDGFFTVDLDFGADVFAGEARYLEIGVRPGDSVAGYTLLTPRQPLNAGPYAHYALTAGSVQETLFVDNDNVGIGTTSPTARLEVQGEVKSVVGADDFYMVPAGAIIMWSGALADIPDGWALCDGTNGTPDLRDRFILSVSTAEDPGATGGAASHSHTVGAHAHSIDPPNISTTSSGSHDHSMSGSPSLASPSVNIGLRGGILNDGRNHSHDIFNAGSHSHSVNIGPFSSSSASPNMSSQDHRPPYFKLAFLMRSS